MFARLIAPTAAFVTLGFACGGSSKAPPQDRPPPPAPPTFVLTKPEDQLTPELNQLLSQLELSNANLAGVSAQIAAHNHAAANKRAGRRLIELADKVASPGWKSNQRTDVVEANAKRGYVASEAQLATQLEEMQTVALAPIYQAMQQVRDEAVVEHGLAIVRNLALPPDRRALAHGVLSMQLPPGDPRSAEVARFGEEIDKKLAVSRENPAAMVKAQETIQTMSEPLQSCFMAELNKTPDLAGATGKLRLEIDKTGAVTSASAPDIAPPSLRACVENVGRAATFAQTSDKTTMFVPINFKKQ